MAEETSTLTTAPAFECMFCKSGFKTEKGYGRHICAKRSHALAIGEENVFRVHRLFNFWFFFNKFSRKKESKTMDEFIRSPYFGTFCDLYGFCQAVKIGDIREYLKWLSTQNVPANKWHNADVVAAFRRFAITNGDAHDQAIKTVEKIIRWGEETGKEYSAFFEEVDVADALSMIDRGDLSAWVICLSEKTPLLLMRFSEANTDYFNEMIDIGYWLSRIEVSKADADRIRATLTQMEL